MWQTVKHLSNLTDICPEEVRRKIARMKLSGVYPREVFFTNPLRVDVDAFIHFNTYQQLIINGKPFPEWEKS